LIKKKIVQVESLGFCPSEGYAVGAEPVGVQSPLRPCWYPPLRLDVAGHVSASPRPFQCCQLLLIEVYLTWLLVADRLPVNFILCFEKSVVRLQLPRPVHCVNTDRVPSA